MSKQRIVLASSNPHKVDELQKMLAGIEAQIIPQSDFSMTEAVESGETFVENALIKARHASRLSGLPAIADDSGLTVKILGGAPGVHSARYAGTPQNAAANIAKLLEALRNVPAAERNAAFHCILVYLRAWDDPVPLIAEGSWQGLIPESPRGTGGFGYDPVFFDPQVQCSAAELSASMKNRLSHRGKALRRLLRQMRNI